MSAALPSFDDGPVPLGQIRDEARKLLVDALDSRRGKKVLVLDPRISGFLGLLAEVPLLKEHGVEQLLHLGTAPLGDLGVRNVVYLARCRIENAQLIARQVKAANQQQPGLEFAVFWLPRRTIACERVLQEEGVYGDVAAGELPVDFIPFDGDVLSLELDTAFRELSAEGDQGSLYYVARALARLQAAFGAIPRLKGRGPGASAVRGMLARMRREQGAPAPAVGGCFDEAVLLDRSLDCVTPMCTQLTYEGLVDETLRIRNGAVTLDSPAGGKQRIVLNSADRVFRELRDLSFAAVGPCLGERAKAIQADYKDSKAGERSLAELRDFAAALKALPHIQRHIGLAEAVNKIIAAPNFRARVRVEQALLDGHGLDASAEAIEEMMAAEEDIFVVLRLMCLLSLTQGGVPKKHQDALRRELLHTYGHEYLITLSLLQAAGLLKRQESGKPAFPALKRAFRLLVDGVDDRAPADIAFAFSGYAPLLVRLLEAAVRGPGWGVPEDVLRQLPGPGFEVVQAADEAGLPVERPAPPRPPPTGKRRVVLVVVIGGITFAEINAIRFLGGRPEVNCDFVVATTKLISGTSLLDDGGGSVRLAADATGKACATDDEGRDDLLDAAAAEHARARAEAAAAAEAAGPQVCDSWEWMVEGVLREVLSSLDFPALKRFRLTCARWRAVADRNLQTLRPSKASVHTVIEQFPSITSIDLSGCLSVRNRNLMVLARSKLRLASLTIGNTTTNVLGKPRITNQALASIAEMTGLTSLSLCDCSALTNNGMLVLTALQGLRSLAVNRCPRIGDKGLLIVQRLSHLTALNCYGCVKVTDATMGVLAGVSTLRSLNTGFTKVTDAGVAALARLPHLAALALYAETVTNAALRAAAALPALTSISLSNCYEVTGDGVVALAHAVPGLRRLALLNCELSDDHMIALASLLPNLHTLQVQGTVFADRGVRALTGLRSLRCLALEVYQNAAMDGLVCLSVITQVTQLQVQCTQLNLDLLAAISRLPHLADLNLAQFDQTATQRGQSGLSWSMLNVLVSMRSLTALDLSYMAINEDQVRRLVELLPRLERLCLYACPVAPAFLEAIMAAWPRLEATTQRRPSMPLRLSG
ncbi:hypothetical protein WJX81_004070 [Elliptochloris bilobata]|uniref:F-box domain-containing protein n=1 Tax=Elliptochloris bilobata TaxID=381761 RepID=A0AAW1SCQ3_9CHLO